MEAEVVINTEIKTRTRTKAQTSTRGGDQKNTDSGFVKRALKTILTMWAILLGGSSVAYGIYSVLNGIGINVVARLSIALGISMVFILLILLSLPKSFLLIIKKEDICSLTPFTLLKALRKPPTKQPNQFTELMESIARVEDIVSQVQTTLVEVHDRVNKLEATSARTESRFNKLEATSVQVEGKVNRLEATLAQVQDSIKPKKRRLF